MIAETLSNLNAEEIAPQSSIRKMRGSDAEATMVDALAVGKILAGKYRVERKIGEGAMGVVLAATHLGLDEAVAIKFMRPEVQSMEGTLARFAKEAKIAARIRSEHVAKVLDVGELEPLGPFIVMEYLEGESLADLLDTRLRQGRGPLPDERVVEYALQACEALAAAHAIGVVHRDVKPDNLFVTRHGGLETLKLLDFGISKTALPGASLRANTLSFVMGTPLYMSPEQLRSSPDIDCRTDIWSMGVVMYELVSGEPPFNAESIPEICAGILELTPPTLGCSAGLEQVVRRCLEKDPARRFQTVADLATALVPLASGDARAYASRSSCILRASALNLAVGPAVVAAARREPVQTTRFQDSALVAAATVLALAALGVAMIFAKMQVRAEPFRVVAAERSGATTLTVLPPLHEPGVPSIHISKVPTSELLPVEAPAPTSGVALGLPPLELPATRPIARRGATSRLATANLSAVRPKVARAPTNAQKASSVTDGIATVAELGPTASIAEGPRTGRVRLESRARPQSTRDQ